MKKVTIQHFMLAGCFLLALVSCGPVLYVPNTLNTPLLAEKGDFKGSIGVAGTAPEANVELQGSYAFTNKLAVMGNFFTMNGKTSHRLVEGGAGVYNSFWKNKSGTNIGRAEVFGGTGFGTGSDEEGGFHFFRNSTTRYSGTYQRIFLQPAAGIRTRIVDISVASRIAYVHFSDFKQSAVMGQPQDMSFGFSTFEPVVTFSLGYQWLKFYMQMGSVSPIGNARNYYSVTNHLWEGGHLNLGLVGCPWREKPLERPSVALGESPSRQHADPAQEDMEQPDAEQTAPKEAPPTLLPVSEPGITVCLRDAGSPDGDVVSASFNGAYIFENLELEKKWNCTELTVLPGTDNLLRVSAISEGKIKSVTVQILVREGKSERTFYLRLAEGQTEEVRLVR